MVDYPCDKFGDCSFSHFGSIVRTDRQTHTRSDTDERFTPATLVDVSNRLSSKMLLQQLRLDF